MDSKTNTAMRRRDQLIGLWVTLLCILYLFYGDPLLNERSLTSNGLGNKIDRLHDGPNWADVASKKRTETHRKIPKEWLLDPLTLLQVKNQRKLTGPFIEGLLDLETREITGLDSVAIVEKVRNGSYTAVQVTRAFCKRAAIAQQLVCRFRVHLLSSLFTPWSAE
jgi:hypothetical protein